MNEADYDREQRRLWRLEVLGLFLTWLGSVIVATSLIVFLSH